MKGNTVYSNAICKALEPKLIGESKINRMIDGDSCDDALKVLYESGFGEGVSIQSALDFENLIYGEKEKFSKFLIELAPDEKIAKYFLLSSDYANAQALIRNKYLKIDVSNMLTSNGIYDKNVLKEKIMKDDYSLFTDNLANALLEVDNLFVDNKATGSNVDGVFKKALYKDLYKISLSNADLKKIYSVRADCVNISTALRCESYEIFKGLKIVGGVVDDKILELLCQKDFESVRKSIEFANCKEIINYALNNFEANEPLTMLEKYADDYAVSYFKKSLYDTSSVKPFILYCFYKQSEFANVRIVMVGLINKFDKEQIKKRVREGYAG